MGIMWSGDNDIEKVVPGQAWLSWNSWWYNDNILGLANEV